MPRKGKEVWQPQRPVSDGTRQGRRLRAERMGGGHESGNRFPHAALAPPSSHLKPAFGHSVHVPPHGAGGCGRGRVLRRAECKDEAPRAGPGVPGPGEGRGTAGRGRRRGGETSRLRLGLLHLPWRRRRRRLLVASSSLSSASTSTQNKNTPHLPATPLLIGQSSPGLGTAWGGEGGARGSGGAGPPLPHSREQPATVGPGAARERRRREPALASQAGKPTASRRGREVSICLCIFVYGRGCGAGASARVLADPGERGKQDYCTQYRSPAFLSAGMKHAPTHQALELSV